MQTTYRAGQWYMLVAPGALIALSPDAPEELVARLWDREQAAGDLAAVIDALTEQASGSFTDMLPFAAVVLEGPNARIAVRGDATVQVTGPDGLDTFTGVNVTTWSERFAPDASRIAISVGDGGQGAALPIIGGVVRATGASAEIEPADVAVPDAAPAAVAPIDAPSSEEAEVVEEPEPAALPEAVESPVTAEIEEQADDAVNGVTLLPTEAPGEPEPEPEESEEESDTDVFEQLFGDTLASSPAAATPPPVPPAPPAAREGDHDGATISVAEARALRQDVPPAGPEAPTAVLPVVSAGAGRVRVSTGQVVVLDRTVIIGRRPRSTRASGADLPHLVAVGSPQQDISRSHLEIRPEGDTVVVVDLHTTNGSTLLRPGNDPLRLHPGEQTLVLSGDVVDLGDGVTVTFEDLP